MKNVAVIPARKGSKRVKGKNRLNIGGKTVLERAISAINSSGIIQRSILTTDDLELIASAGKYPSLECLIRPANLSEDHTSSKDVLRQLIGAVGLEEYRIVLLQLTSPFRTGSDLTALYSKMIETGARSGVSVCRWRTPASPSFGCTKDMTRLGDEALPESCIRSASNDRTWAINGALYIFEAAEFLRTGALYNSDSTIHIMENWRSIDIDYYDDVKVAEALATSFNI